MQNKDLTIAGPDIYYDAVLEQTWDHSGIITGRVSDRSMLTSILNLRHMDNILQDIALERQMSV